MAKSIRFAIFTVLMLSWTPVSATDNNKPTKESTQQDSKVSKYDDYTRVEISYSPLSIDCNLTGNEYDMDLNGFGASWIGGISVSEQYPLYIEVGVQLTYAYKSNKYNIDSKDAGSLGIEQLYDATKIQVSDKTAVKNTIRYWSIAVPISLSYNFTIPNSKFSISPFAGISIKYNNSSKSRTEASYDITHLDTQTCESKMWEDEIDNFCKRCAGKDAKWRRWQIGTSIGVRAGYRAVSIGFRYGIDLTTLAKDTRSSGWAVSIGYTY